MSSRRPSPSWGTMPDLPGESGVDEDPLYPPTYTYPGVEESSRQYRAQMILREESEDRGDRLASVDQSPAQSDRVLDQPAPRRRPASERAPVRAVANVVVDDDIVRRTPIRRSRRTELPRDRVVSTGLRASAVTADTVTGTTVGAGRAPSRRMAGRKRSFSLRFPGFRQIAEQALPALVMAASIVGALAIILRAPMLANFWAVFVIAPSLVIRATADRHIRAMWRANAAMNIAIVGAFFPMVIVRQSYLRIPFVSWGNGTLTMPILSTLAVVTMMLVLACAAAILSQDDPEYAGMLFLPAAMTVPFFAGATEIVKLTTALAIMAIVYVAVAGLTLIASMLPGALPMYVAPLALALEFLILPISNRVPIFPEGAATGAKLLFFVVLATAVGLTVAVPSLSGWVRQVRYLVNQRMSAPMRASLNR